MIPQWRTQQILHARLLELGGSVAFGTRLAGFTQDADAVTAELAAADGATRTVRARYLVAADGGRSTVRRALGIAMEGETVDPGPRWSPTCGSRASAGTTGTAGPRRPAGCCCSARWRAPRPSNSSPSTRRGAGHLVRRHPRAGRRADRARRRGGARGALGLRLPPRAALAERYREGRVFLAGDAAHVHSPAGGQGLNTSVQDAYNLGWKLGRVLRHGAPDALLDSYQDERRPVAADVLGLSTKLHQGTFVGGSGPVQRGKQTSQLGVGYPDSTLSVERRTDLPAEALRAGQRVPDLGYAGSARLFDLLRGPHATLLAVGIPAPELDDPELLVRELDELAGFGPGLFLIRPDGYLGLATRDAADLASYLGLVTGVRQRV